MRRIKSLLSNTGYGYGNGNGNGDGNGCSGIKSFCGQPVYNIDDVSTLISSVRNNVAKGFILHDDMTTNPCYIVRQGNLFAHGETLHGAQKALQDKIFEDMGEEERIGMFLEEFKLDTKYPAMTFFDWHNKLTGSCEMGRKEFAREHGIDLGHDEFTVAEFIKLTENAYGSEVISLLKRKVEENG